MWLQPLWVAQGWGRQEHHHLGGLVLRASVICATLTTIMLRFIGLSGMFTHSCYETAHNKLVLSEKMPFSYRPGDAGRVANKATCNNRKILVQQTQTIP